MSQTVIVELSEQAFAALRRQAEEAGLSPAHLAAVSLEQRFGTGQPRTAAQEQAARERFARQIGAIDLGHPTGTDNEGIDADLAREYADSHEGG